MVRTDADGAVRRDECQIVIDLDKKRIDDRTTDWLLGQEYLGSAAIGLVLLTLPITIPAAPFIALSRSYYAHLEQRREMSRHAVALLDALKGQLDNETQLLLEDALRNTWKHEQYLSRRLTFAEAKELLATCELKVRMRARATLTPEARNADVRLISSYEWIDANGDYVAQCRSPGLGNISVGVLGSEFATSDEYDVRELLDCFREKTYESPDDDFDDFIDEPVDAT